MKKLLLILLFPISFVFAQEVNVYYYAEGATSHTDNITIESEIITLVKDSSYYSTYDINATIPHINIMNGETFNIYKENTRLVPDKEWYIYDDYEKKHYFSQSKSYSISDIVKELGLQNESFIMLNFHANWENSKDDTSTSTNNNEVVAKSVKLNVTSLALDTKDTYQLTVTISPSDTYNKTLTWSSSNSKIVSVNTYGKITALKKGTATITVKTKNGIKASCNVTVGDKKIKTVNIQYMANGGTLAKVHHKETEIKNDIIYYKGKKIFHKALWGNTIGTSGLTNYNNPNYINIVKSGYTVPQGAEWNTKKDGTGISYSQSKSYNASDFCDASKNDCTVVLYINWKSTKKTLNIKFDLNGGTIANPHGDVGVRNGLLSWNNGTTTVASINATSTIGKNGLVNYNNPNFANIKKSGYIPQAGAEWNTKKDGTGKSYSQSVEYKASDFCNNKTSGCDVTLYLNWKPVQVQNKVDVVLMIGQSNMVGWASRGEDVTRKTKDTRKQDESLYNDLNNPYDDTILKYYTSLNHVNYTIPKNVAWDYSYNADRFSDLYNNGKYLTTFGETILASQNNVTSFEHSNGTNIVPYFALTYTKETGHKLAIIHAALGGKLIECFLPTNDKNYTCDQKRYMYETINAKYKKAIKHLQKNGYTIDNTFYVIMQGESNSLNKTNNYKTYYNNYMRVHNYLKKNLGLKFGAIIYTSHRPSTRKNKDYCKKIDLLHNEQVKLIKNNKDIMLASDWGYKRYTENYTPAFGLPAHSYTENGKKVDVVDNSIHFTSASLSKIGVDSAINISKRINNPSYDTSYTGYTKNC